MQTIIGAGGPIANELAKALTSYTTDIRLVSRNPAKVNHTDQIFVADILKKEELRKAIMGSDVIYITVGFEYKTKVWRSNWPNFIKNCIDICKKQNVKLVFFDNVYMYDQNELNNMTENSAINPVSEKGKVRQEIAKLLTDEMKIGKLKVTIARSADFYGPSILKTSMLTETVLNNLANGKKANWMCSDKFKHSMTYTPDAGKAVALLGNTIDAYGDVWHLPTAKSAPTGKEWIEMVAKELQTKSKSQIVPKWMVRIIGLFVPIMGEMVEMLYQYDREYVFNSDKFESKFDFKPTSYENGIREIVSIDYSN